jgi:hypothetical protein
MIFLKQPKMGDEIKTISVRPIVTISQFIFLSIVIVACFYQPQFLVDLINQAVTGLPN